MLKYGSVGNQAAESSGRKIDDMMVKIMHWGPRRLGRLVLCNTNCFLERRRLAPKSQEGWLSRTLDGFLHGSSAV